jgi:hypothetical protein
MESPQSGGPLLVFSHCNYTIVVTEELRQRRKLMWAKTKIIVAISSTPMGSYDYRDNGLAINI